MKYYYSDSDELLPEAARVVKPRKYHAHTKDIFNG